MIEREVMTPRQAVSIHVIFLFGSTAIMGVSLSSAQDSWFSLLLAAAFSVPLYLIYARIVRLFPGKNLFEIIEFLFGNIPGKIGAALLVFYSIHLCSLVLKNFSEFIAVCVMPETPQLAIMISMLLVVYYVTKSGLESLGKWSLFMLPITILFMVMTTILAINKMDASRLLPLFSHDLKHLSVGAYKLFTFPYAELVISLCAVCKIKQSASSYKVYLYSLLISTAFLLTIMLRNTLVLGTSVVDAEYFPSYAAAKVIDIADLLSRLEGSIAMNFIVAGIVKMALCVVAASKGFAHLIEARDYKRLLLPTGLLCVAMASTLFKSIMEMMEFIDVYQFYAVPFQIAIPLAVWVTAEVKVRRGSLPRPQRAAAGAPGE